MLASGMSFKRLLRPYLISAALIAILNFYLGSYIIPKGTVVRHDFESLYKNNKKNTSASNIQLMVDKGVVAYISQYDDIRKTGYGFALYKFENKKMVSQMNANVIQYDTDTHAERYARGDYQWLRDRHADTDGTYGPGLLQRSAGDVHVARAEAIHLQAATARLKQCRAV